LGLTILTLALHETGQLELLKDLLSLVTGPIQRALSGAAGGIGGTFSSVGDARELQNQVDELQAIANDLAAQNVHLKEVEAENAQLRELLNFITANPALHSYVGAQVIGQDPNPYIFYVIINRGSQDDLAIGMPVVASGGRLVGRIDEVRPRWSKVQLLIDPSSQVNGIVQGSRADGLVTGQADGSLTLDKVLQSEQINVDDTVVTSGRGGRLPKGLLIGQVTEIDKQDINPHQRAVLRPAVNFSRLELVLVITNFDPIPVGD
jgi:rod shape-determining protein MreC